jgi:glycosyltransferase involved in cell wall biosynthesis
VRVLHVLGWYLPESSGGTEIYVHALARALRDLGVESAIAAPAATAAAARADTIDGLPVYRYHVGAPSPAEIAHGTPPAGFDAFRAWLDQHRPDVYHQHSWTRGCGLPHLQYAHASGLRTVLTVHVPSVICLRGTMMRDGTEACDGRVESRQCVPCWSASRGIPAGIAAWQVRQPGLSAAISSRLPVSRLRTLFATPALVDARRDALRTLVSHADQVVAVSGWLHEALAANGVDPRRLHLVRQGTGAAAPAASWRPSVSGTCRVGVIGRWDPVKGIDVAVDAVRALPASVAIELTIHGLPGDAAYEARVRAAAGGDQRIVFAGPLPHAQVTTALARFDVLAVPSQWLETGPLVVLEAFAAGTPVVGSDLGGIRELVTPGVDGVLVDAGRRDAWSRALQALAQGQAATLRRGVTSPRTVHAVARDMFDIYTGLISR